MVKIDDLKFTQLRKNRYAQYRPEGRKLIPLEKVIEHHNSHSWQDIYIQIDKYIDEILNKADLIFNDKVPRKET